MRTAHGHQTRYTGMVQKYIRPILIIVIIIMAGAGGALAVTKDSSWFQHAFSSGDSASQGAHAKPTWAPPNVSNGPTFATYAALGDSVAAGAGLPNVPNASATDNQCARSVQAYPEVLAKKVDAKLTFAACGGATTSHLLTAQTFSNLSNAPQLTTAFAHGVPQLITITLGANDMRWIQIIQSCYTGVCGSAADTAAVNNQLSDFTMKLYYDLHQINLRSNGHPPVIMLTSYYQLGSNQCLSSIAPNQVTANEVTWLSQETTTLNATIQSVAKEFPNAHYVALNAKNHGPCATGNSRWVQGLGDPAPFHLTASGEQAMADAIYAQLKTTK